VAFKNAIPVLPGQTYAVVVGAGGVGEGSAGGNSSFSNAVVAAGGMGGTRSGGAGGATVEAWRDAPYTFVTGGRGGDMSWNGVITKDIAGGGGGAAGYPPTSRPAAAFIGARGGCMLLMPSYVGMLVVSCTIPGRACTLQIISALVFGVRACCLDHFAWAHFVKHGTGIVIA
jgi:hypothetical protein